MVNRTIICHAAYALSHASSAYGRKDGKLFRAIFKKARAARARRKGFLTTEVRDDAMAPTLPPGSTILVDLTCREWRPPDLVAVRAGDGLVVARAAYCSQGQRLMVKDNPAWPDVLLPEGAQIVGCVRSVARPLD